VFPIRTVKNTIKRSAIDDEIKLGYLKKRCGRPAYITKPPEDDLRRLYEAESRSVRDIANLLGCSKDIVFRCLREYKITPRTNARRSFLRQYDIADLKAGVREKGIRGLAKELGIDESTLRHHLKIRKGL
jgi:hypothetical protein